MQQKVPRCCSRQGRVMVKTLAASKASRCTTPALISRNTKHCSRKTAFASWNIKWKMQPVAGRRSIYASRRRDDIARQAARAMSLLPMKTTIKSRTSVETVVRTTKRQRVGLTGLYRPLPLPCRRHHIAPQVHCDPRPSRLSQAGLPAPLGRKLRQRLPGRQCRHLRRRF